MTDQVSTEPLQEEITSTKDPAPPKKIPRKWSFVLVVVCSVVFLLLIVPAVLLAAVGAYLLLTPNAPQVFTATGPAANNVEQPLPSEAPQRKDEHPLDPALAIAYEGLAHMNKNVNDYTANVVKRERIGGTLKEEGTSFVKIRSRKKDGDEIVVPFSVYMKSLEPKSEAGREVVFVENQNNGKLIAHDPNLFSLIQFRYFLWPKGIIPMRGERYPITDLGLEVLVEELIRRGERDRQLDLERGHVSVEVKIDKDVVFLGRACTRIEVRHPEKTPEAEYLYAEIYIDQERNVPLRYAAYIWPEKEGGEPLVDEEYTYKDLVLDVGLTDADFDPDNKEYKFPAAVFAGATKDTPIQETPPKE